MDTGSSVNPRYLQKKCWLFHTSLWCLFTFVCLSLILRHEPIDIKCTKRHRYLWWDTCNSAPLNKINKLSIFNIIMSTCLCLWLIFMWQCESISSFGRVLDCLAMGPRFKPQYIEVKCLCSNSINMHTIMLTCNTNESHVIDVFLIFMHFDVLFSFNNCN